MISLSILYYIYLIAVAFFIIFSLFNIYHLLRFGFLNKINVLVILLYLIVAGSFLAFSFYKLSTIDWNQPLIDFTNLFKSENANMFL